MMAYNPAAVLRQNEATRIAMYREGIAIRREYLSRTNRHVCETCDAQSLKDIAEWERAIAEYEAGQS
jgi:hypothetical protein